MESVFGSDNYFVHFNRRLGVADAILDVNPARFMRNLFRKNVPAAPPEPGMMMINLETATAPAGDPVMSDEDLAAFEETGFTASINWYRNVDRNWHILAEFVPNVDVRTLDCGHWIQQEKPEETTRAILDWHEIGRADWTAVTVLRPARALSVRAIPCSC